MNEPIFISGISRSGTTLLCTILNNHPEMSLCFETRFFVKIANGVKKFNLSQRIEDADKAIREIHNLGKNKTTAESVKADFLKTNQSLIALYGTILKAKMKCEGKKRFGEKMPGNFLYLGILLKYYPDAKIIFITRDPRHAYCSFKYGAAKNYKFFIPKTSFVRALLWVLFIKHRRKYQKSMSATQVRCVKFEDVINEPAKTIRMLCNFLGEEYYENMLNVNSINSSFDELREKSGIRKEPLNRIGLLNKRERFFIELICGKYMLEEGYTLSTIRYSIVDTLKTLKFYFCLEQSYFCWRKVRYMFGG